MHEHLAAFEAGRPDRGRRCSSGGRRRRPRCSGPRSAAIARASPTRGSSRPPGWSTTSTSTAWTSDFGPFFLKFCSYFPYNAKLCINGNHWAQRQAAKAGIAFEALDNGFAAVERPRRPAADLRPAGTGADRRAAAQMAGPAAAPVHPGRPGRRLPLRHLHPAGRVLPDPDARQARVRAGLLRAGHPRQPRHRPPRPGQPDLRPPADAQPAPAPPRDGSAPG